jgi:hypothetical protein
LDIGLIVQDYTAHCPPPRDSPSFPESRKWQLPFRKGIGGNVYGAILPSHCPAIQYDIVEFLFILQWAENRELLYQWLAVKGFHAAIVESQPQQIIVKRFRCDNPYNIVAIFHFILRV